MASNYSPGYDDDRFEVNVNRNFHCLICYNVLKDPVMCRNNQHYFCRCCITEHLRRNARSCPTCADELTVETLNDAPRIVKDYLNDLRIRCDYYDRGCRKPVLLQNFDGHVAACGFTPVVCRNQGCDEIINKRDRRYHESVHCQFRDLKLLDCKELIGLIADMKSEMNELDTKMENTSTQMSDVRTKIAETNTEVTDAKTEMLRTDARVENVDTKLKIVHAKVTMIVSKLENFQEEVQAKFGKVNNDMTLMKASLNEMKEGFDNLTKAVLENLERKSSQDDVNDTASGRPEEQHILVAGGVGRNSVEVFNYRQRSWSFLKPMTEDHDGASAFVYNDQVTVVGGLCDEGAMNNMIAMDIRRIPDLSTNWGYLAAKLPAKMFAHGSVVYKDSLFITGGYYEDQDDVSGCIYEMELKPLHPFKLVFTMPEPRAFHSTVLCDDEILIIGGRKSASWEDNVSSVLSYDIKRKVCQQLPELPYPVSEMATVKCGENVVIVGGVENNGKAMNNVIIYHVKTGNSYELPPMLQKRRGCMAVVVGKTIVVLGGRCEGRSLKSVEAFNFERFSWEELPDMNETRFQATAVVI